MPKNNVGEWPGGWIHQSKDGRRTYVIRRLGREVSTRCTGIRAALKHLERFEADPAGYDPRVASQSDPLYLDHALVKEFLTWSRHERKNTKEWVRDQRFYLAWWADKLADKNLRIVKRVDLEDALQGVTRYKRAEIVKTFFRWLRKRGKITAAEDPTIDGLDATPPQAEQLTRDKTVSPERFRGALGHLVGTYRHCLIILGATGWHVTELHRFAQRGRIEAKEGRPVLVCPWHKTGEPHRTEVAPEAEESARALLAYGPFSRSRLDKAVKEACELAGVEEFTPGQMRHTIGTLAVQSGDTMAAVADFLGHKSPRTTKKFYATHATAKRVTTLV